MAVRRSDKRIDGLQITRPFLGVDGPAAVVDAVQLWVEASLLSTQHRFPGFIVVSVLLLSTLCLFGKHSKSPAACFLPSNRDRQRERGRERERERDSTTDEMFCSTRIRGADSGAAGHKGLGLVAAAFCLFCVLVCDASLTPLSSSSKPTKAAAATTTKTTNRATPLRTPAEVPHHRAAAFTLIDATRTRGGGGPNEEPSQSQSQSNEKDVVQGGEDNGTVGASDSNPVKEDDETVDSTNSGSDEEGGVAVQGPDTESIREQAHALRQQGKELHDMGEYEEAATLFQQAADLLLPLTTMDESNGDDDNTIGISTSENKSILEEHCTCRLHEALCRLKVNDYEGCVDVCTDVLEHPHAIGPIRARALHRRAKAYLCLDKESEALQDARSAAFLGDRRAVALYGKLMRNTGSSSDDDSFSPGGLSALAASSGMGMDTQTPPLLQDLFAGKNPFLDDSGVGGGTQGMPSFGSNPLLSSMLSKSPLSGLASAVGNNAPGGSPGASKLVESVVKKAVDKLTDDADSICGFLQSTSAPQLQQWAGIAGVSLQQPMAERLVGVCHSITPAKITGTVAWSKRILSVVRLMNKTMKLIRKYRQVLIVLAICFWIQSAIKQPIPISKKAALAAAAAATTATKGTST